MPPRLLRLQLLVPLLAVTMMLTGCATTTTSTSPTMVATRAATTATATATEPTIAVLGDSFVVGVGGHVKYVSLLQSKLDVKTTNFGQGGTGFVASGSGSPYGKRIAKLMATKPNALVIQASVNDSIYSSASVVSAAKKVVAKARSANSTLKIAIVGPIFLRTQNNAAMLRLRAALKKFAASAHVTYIDPTGWITNATKHTYIGPDNLHPTAAGYRHIATMMAKALKPFVASLG